MAAAAGWTQLQLAEQLDRLGIKQDVDILVHASMRAVGWVDGGPAVVLAALRDALGPKATIVMPTQTADNSTTSSAYQRQIAGMSDAGIRRHQSLMPGFNVARTPSAGMGILAEYVRCLADARRSNHPQTSFAAVGPNAEKITRDHPPHSHLGTRSPLGALYARGAQVLLLGVGYDKATAFHLAEYRLNGLQRTYRCKVQAPGTGESVWLEFRANELDDSDFSSIGVKMQAEVDWISIGQVGAARSIRFPMRQAVDYAEQWMRRERSTIPGNQSCVLTIESAHSRSANPSR